MPANINSVWQNQSCWTSLNCKFKRFFYYSSSWLFQRIRIFSFYSFPFNTRELDYLYHF